MTAPLPQAQQPAKTDSIAVSSEEGCRVPVAILGQVVSPSRLELRRRTTLRDLIAFAGGVTKRAKGTVQILHTEPNRVCESFAPKDFDNTVIDFDKPETYLKTYRLADVLRGDGKANPVLRPGDVADVLEMDHVSVIGSVMKPQKVYLGKRLTVARAIAQAGGLSPDARRDNVYVHRRAAARWTVIAVNPQTISKAPAQELVLQPNDIVEVLSRKGTAQPSVFPIRIIP